jgi:hypothetical protein
MLVFNNMEPENNQVESRLAPLQKVTPLSKYLAAALFIVMPFIGGWIGYRYAPEKVVEIQKSIVVEKLATAEQEVTGIERYFTPIEITSLDGGEYQSSTEKLIGYGDLLYVLRVLPMEAGLSLTLLPEVSLDPSVAADFTSLGGGYLKNNQDVIFVGEAFAAPQVVNTADSLLFNTIVASPAADATSSVVFGVDNTSVYYQGVLLEGIEPESVQFIFDSTYKIPVVFDADAYWYPDGNCHTAIYRKGTQEEFSEYIFPC